MDWPKEMHCPSSQVTTSPASASRRRNSSSRRDLPIPASPEMNTAWPCPALASPKRSRSVSTSRERPMRGVSPRSAVASKRERRCRGRSTSQARTDVCPFTWTSPKSSVSKKPETSRWVASLTTTLPGLAICCMRAARLVVSPTAV